MNVFVAHDFIVICICSIKLGTLVFHIDDGDVLIKAQPFIGDTTIALLFTATRMCGNCATGSGVILLVFGTLFVCTLA